MISELDVGLASSSDDDELEEGILNESYTMAAVVSARDEFRLQVE